MDTEKIKELACQLKNAAEELWYIVDPDTAQPPASVDAEAAPEAPVDEPTAPEAPTADEPQTDSEAPAEKPEIHDVDENGNPIG